MKIKKYINLGIVFVVTMGLSFINFANATSLELSNDSFLPENGMKINKLVETIKVIENDDKSSIIDDDKDTEDIDIKDVCNFELENGVEEEYSAEFITIRRKLKVEEGSEFQVKVFFKNAGTTPWFKSDGGCSGPRVSLRTSQERTRQSELYPGSKAEDSNWETGSSIRLDQDRVEPGHIGSFTFTAKAPDHEDILKEYMTVYVWGEDYLDESEFSFNVIVGDPSFTHEEVRQKMEYSFESGSIMDLDLTGARSLVVDLSDQEVELRLGDSVVKTFPVSTGKASTPTPVGSYKISLKQDVRISHSSPHYIMPKFMWFRAGGYGFHALPSLQYGNGSFWTEARNHIGTPASHGCIRLLPEDADYIYDFSEIGTEVTVKW